MTRTWNPRWQYIEPYEGAVYLATTRAIVLTSINWIEAHPNLKANWYRHRLRSRMRQAGVPDSVPEDDFLVFAPWEEVYQSQNYNTRMWFAAMDEAARAINQGQAPTANMMREGIVCGAILATEGWSAFDNYMRSRTKTVEREIEQETFARWLVYETTRLLRAAKEGGQLIQRRPRSA